MNAASARSARAVRPPIRKVLPLSYQPTARPQEAPIYTVILWAVLLSVTMACLLVASSRKTVIIEEGTAGDPGIELGPDELLLSGGFPLEPASAKVDRS